MDTAADLLDPVPIPALPPAEKLRRLSVAEWERFQRDGFLVFRQLIPAAIREQMLAVTLDGVQREIGPVEYEAELHYPGAPPSLAAEGGRTIRRLKQAHSRHAVFTQWLSDHELVDRLADLLGPKLVMPLAHHNCIMTKQPKFSSDTGWHQDIRYWAYQRPDLISVWISLVPERVENGCLRVIPGSHRMSFVVRRGRSTECPQIAPPPGFISLFLLKGTPSVADSAPCRRASTPLEPSRAPAD